MLNFEAVCSLYFEHSGRWRFPGGRVEDYMEEWTREVASEDELRGIQLGLDEFLDGNPDERACRSFLDANGADIHKLDTQELSILAFLKSWQALVAEQLKTLD